MDEFVKVFEGLDELEIQLIVNLLNDNGIHCMRKDEGSGQYLRLYMGTSMFAKTIFANKEDSEKALELIKEMKSQSTKNNIENDIDEENSPNIKVKTTVAKLIIGTAAFATIASVLTVIIFFFIK